MQPQNVGQQPNFSEIDYDISKEMPELVNTWKDRGSACQLHVQFVNLPFNNPDFDGDQLMNIGYGRNSHVYINSFTRNIILTQCDAIVNPAQSDLQPGTNPKTVGGAIFQAAGNELNAQCKQIANQNKIAPGNAVLTSACNLSSTVKYIIHAVGPDCNVYDDHGQITTNFKDPNAPNNSNRYLRLQLRACYHNVLCLADRKKLRALAVPLISVGFYRYPYQDAYMQAIMTIAQYFYDHPDSSIEQINFCVFGNDAGNLRQALKEAAYRTATPGIPQAACPTTPYGVPQLPYPGGIF
jgi:O-acetyl-ADP-ribose deacetylase (regulator of RNase III)